jgi:microcystin-dependent protein
VSSLESSGLSSSGNTGPADDRPLTPQEYQLLQRLLSDPFSLPVQFKSWLISYVETSDVNLPLSSINGLTNILGISGVGGGTIGLLPAGVILPFGGDAAPTGALLCNGASYGIVGNERLYDAIGLRYTPTGSPAGTFNVPDLQGRMPVGKGTHADVDTLGKDDGSALPARRPRHKSSINEAPHSHGLSPNGPVEAFNPNAASGGSGAASGDRSLRVVNTTTADATGITAGPQTGAEPVDTPAYVVVNFIIIA